MSALPLASDDWPSRLRRSGPISQFPARRVVSSCCLLLLGRARPSSVLFSESMGCDTVFALPATLSTASSLDSTPTNGRRITLQPNLSVATCPTLYMRRLAPHSTLACPRHHTSSSHQEIHCIPRWLHAMDVYVPRSI